MIFKRYCRRLDRPLHKGKNKKEIGVMKDELDGQMMKESFGLRAKTSSYLKDNNDKDKTSKGIKKCLIKRKLKFQDYKKLFRSSSNWK